MKAAILIFSLSLSLAATTTDDHENKEKRQLGLFAIVNFKNDECTAVEGTYKALKGTCFSSSECSEKGGSDSGNCAAGFGVCCVFVTTATSATISNNCTYVQNSAYPTTIASTATSVDIKYAPTNSGNICNIRFDFVDVVIGAAEDTSLTAAAARIQFTSPTSQHIPLVNGYLTGQHVYVETGRSSTNTQMQVVTLAATTIASHWRIKASFIECDSVVRPPNGCHQYLTGATGIIGSYNSFNPTSASNWQLALQQHSTCIRREKNMCLVSYEKIIFTVGAATAMSQQHGGTANPQCAAGALIIPGAITPDEVEITIIQAAIGNTELVFYGTNVLCNAHFSTTSHSALDTVVYQKPPFITHFEATASVANVLGYKLGYNQLGCTSAAAI